MPWLLGHVENWLIRNIRLISKFMTTQPGQQTITIPLLPNIWQPDNEENIAREICFLKNYTQNVMEKFEYLENEKR